jgi:ParB family chromosome partitioning protein
MSFTTQPKFAWISIERIHANPKQPRRWFDQEKIEELAHSIAQHGILQPLVLDENDLIIAGERRFRAAQWLGLIELPCMIVSGLKDQPTILALIENLQREQMEPLEQAFAFARLQQEHAWTHEHIAKTLGKSRVYVTNILRLLKLSQPLMHALESGEITYGHAKVLVGLSEQKQLDFLSYVKTQSASVRQLEQRVALSKQQSESLISSEEELHGHFLRSLAEQVGTQVAMDQNSKQGGWLKFKFFDQETLQGLLQKLGLVYD